MLLRSSSAPRTLFLGCANRSSEANTSNSNLNVLQEHCTAKISFCRGLQHLRSFSCNSSPVNPFKSCLSEFSPKGVSTVRKTLGRAYSDSNLEGLAFAATPDLEELYNSRILRSRSIQNHRRTMLRTEPSFSIYNSGDKDHDGSENEDLIEKQLMQNKTKLEKTPTIGGRIEAQFSFGKNAMLMIKEDDNENEEVEGDKERALGQFRDLKIDTQGESMSAPICLATGDGGVGANEIGGGFGPSDAGDNGDLEKYYYRMVHLEPSNALVLRNYAQFLESKGDLSNAEEYYHRATMADPKDGEILSRYAKLVWNLHRDEDRASTYFERAVRIAPQDSHVQAAYASFLWDLDGAEEEEHLSNTQVDKNAVPVHHMSMDFEEERRPSSPPLHLAMGLGIDFAGFGGNNATSDGRDANDITTVEENYRKMVKESPHNPLILGNYAQFLHQTKRDLHGAEDFYARATLADPRDGQILSLYAGIVWQLHRDKVRAIAYFERAVQAAPADSNVLGAYAKFLWETEDEEDVEEDGSRMQVDQGALTAANA